IHGRAPAEISGSMRWKSVRQDATSPPIASLPTSTALDPDAGMQAVLDAAAEDRPDRVREMLAPAAGMFKFFPGEVDLATMHLQSLGFPLDRALAETRSALDALRRADAWDRIRTALTAAPDAQLDTTPDITVPDPTVLRVVGAPPDAYLMDEALGLSGNGALTGGLMLTLRPAEENLARVGAAAVHELHHHLRYAPGGVLWDP